MSELLEQSPLGPDRFPNAFRSPTGRIHVMRRPELVIPQVSANTPSEVFSPEAHKLAELEDVEREAAGVVANVAVMVRAGMERLGPIPEGASKEEVDRRKDHLDKLATLVMRAGVTRMQNGINFVDGEGVQDQLLGANITTLLGGRGRDHHKRDGVNDPLECTALAAEGSDFENGIEGPRGIKTFMVFGAPGGFEELPKNNGKYYEILAAPDVGGLSIRKDPIVNMHRVIRELGIRPEELRVMILNRPDRNGEAMEGARHLGVDYKFIPSGDFFPSMMVGNERGADGKYQMVVGSGGGPEKIGAAAGFSAAGDGFMEITKWEPDRRDMSRNRVYSYRDLVRAPADSIAVVVAHITDDPFIPELKGVNPGDNSVMVTIKDHRGVRHQRVQADLMNLRRN